MKSRDRILNAAIPVFARKGRFGAHMEDIASLAHINKAMIYYIFHSKDELYLEVLKAVFAEAYRSISGSIDEDLNSKKDYVDLLKRFISAQISFFSENSHYTKIIVDAVSSGAEEIPVAAEYYRSNCGDSEPTAFLRKLIDKGKSEKVFRDVNTDQLIISIMGMALIYFFTGTLTESIGIEIADEAGFLEERKESIIDLVLESILIKDMKKIKQSKRGGI